MVYRWSYLWSSHQLHSSSILGKLKKDLYYKLKQRESYVFPSKKGQTTLSSEPGSLFVIPITWYSLPIPTESTSLEGTLGNWTVCCYYCNVMNRCYTHKKKKGENQHTQVSQNFRVNKGFVISRAIASLEPISQQMQVPSEQCFLGQTQPWVTI